MICVAAILGGMLQSHGRFGPWAAAPILLNVCIIGAALPYFVVEGADAAVAEAEAARLETEYDQDRIKSLIANDGWA